MANQPSFSSTSSTKDNHFYLQILDLGSIAIFISCLLIFRFLIPKKIREREYLFPRPELYSLELSSIPDHITAKDFQTRFLNNDNIIQTAIVKDCSELFRENDKLFEADRAAKQAEIDLLTGPHVAKRSPGIFNRPYLIFTQVTSKGE